MSPKLDNQPELPAGQCPSDNLRRINAESWRKIPDNARQNGGDPLEVTRDGEVRRVVPPEVSAEGTVLTTHVHTHTLLTQTCSFSVSLRSVACPSRLATWQPMSHCMPVGRLLGHLTCDARLIHARSQDNGRQFTTAHHIHWRLSLNLMDRFN